MSEDPFVGLREKLAELKWPRLYMFKFISPADPETLAQVEALFDAKVAEVQLRPSKTGKFISVSAKEMMMDTDRVIERYRAAAQIKGVISL